METPPLSDLSQVSAFLRASGLRIIEARRDRVEGRIMLGPEHHQPWGLVHGGVYTAAVETAASVGASIAASEHGLVAVGVNNNTNFLRSKSDGPVDVVAEPLQQGRTQQLWEVRVVDEEMRLVAVGQVRLQNVTPRD